MTNIKTIHKYLIRYFHKTFWKLEFKYTFLVIFTWLNQSTYVLSRVIYTWKCPFRFEFYDNFYDVCCENYRLWWSAQIWKTLEPADNKLAEMTTQKDYDVTYWFRDDNPTMCKSPHPERERQRLERIETESFYLTVSRQQFLFLMQF